MLCRDYEQFLENKHDVVPPQGFEVSLDSLCPDLYGDRHQFQPWLVQWALKRGKAAIFAHYGFGKTLIQLTWAKQVARFANGRVLILAPLAVVEQTIAEAERFRAFGIRVAACADQGEADAVDTSIVITNYDRVDRFDASKFVGVVLDESSILKQFKGKTKEYLCSTFKHTPFKLCCSATPSPNDPMELLNHIEFLGVADRRKVLSKYFKNDTMNAGKYTIRPFAKDEFWRFVSSWGICLTKPSDLGFSDEGWRLLPVDFRYHEIAVDHSKTWGMADRDGQFSLIRSASLNATNVHKEQRLHIDLIAEAIAQQISQYPTDECIPIWCFTDYESEAIASVMPGAVELKGSEPLKRKQEKLQLFTRGEIKRLITKPEIAGLGLNWQHCCIQAFCMGTSYSFEYFHQALHRLQRHGQTRQVITHIFYPETAKKTKAIIDKKQRQFEEMQAELCNAMRQEQGVSSIFSEYCPTVEMIIPQWFKVPA